jgi:hypothetical protein
VKTEVLCDWYAKYRHRTKAAWNDVGQQGVMNGCKSFMQCWNSSKFIVTWNDVGRRGVMNGCKSFMQCWNGSEIIFVPGLCRIGAKIASQSLTLIYTPRFHVNPPTFTALSYPITGRSALDGIPLSVCNLSSDKELHCKSDVTHILKGFFRVIARLKAEAPRRGKVCLMA